MGQLKHVFVLMLENRSFDHVFGLSGLTAGPPPTLLRPGAKDRLQKDLPHEYDDVQAQMAEGAMTGFPTISGDEAMLAFEPAQTPVLTELANSYLLMDNWYSSMPGPTWPNRYFAHAASAGGLDNSLRSSDAATAVFDPTRCVHFSSGHVFDRLTAAGKAWRVYQGDRFPQVLSLSGMVDAFSSSYAGKFFRPLKDLYADLAKGDAVDYTWIEPKYDSVSSFRSGSSQHPLASFGAGERLIRDVYNSLRASPLWPASLLLVVWDEHGGFYDHLAPPPATPPGDEPLNHRRAKEPRDCKFDRLGPRVPALLISPLLPKGLGSQIFPGQAFDHASIVASLRKTFGLGKELTARDASAATWDAALLSAPRVTHGCLQDSISIVEAASPQAGGICPSVDSFLEIALALDWSLSKQNGSVPLYLGQYKTTVEAIQKDLHGNIEKADKILLQQRLENYFAAVDDLAQFVGP